MPPSNRPSNKNRTTAPTHNGGNDGEIIARPPKKQRRSGGRRKKAAFEEMSRRNKAAFEEIRAEEEKGRTITGWRLSLTATPEEVDVQTYVFPAPAEPTPSTVTIEQLKADEEELARRRSQQQVQLPSPNAEPTATATTRGMVNLLEQPSEEPSIWEHAIVPFLDYYQHLAVAEFLSKDFKKWAEHKDPLLLRKTKIWLRILSFLGPGHHLFVALVCKRLKELYKEYISTIDIQDRPSVLASRVYRRIAATDTFEPYCPRRTGTLCFSWDIKAGNLQHLKFVHQQGCLIPPHYMKAVFAGGQLEMMKYLVENKPRQWEGATYLCFAARYGHFDILKYLHEKGELHLQSNYPQETCAGAAEGGHLEILKWLYEKGCAWDETACYWAAKKGHLEILKWLHEKGCPWDESTCYYAAKCGHLEVAEWAHRQGCPWPNRHQYLDEY